MTIGDKSTLRHRAYDLANAFVAGPDRSLRLANELEAVVEECYAGDIDMEDLVIALACYRPEGGVQLYNEAEMVALVSSYLQKMKQSCASDK